MFIDTNRPYPKRARLKDKNFYNGIRAYFITINTYNKQRFFTKPNIVKSMVKYLKQIADINEFDILAYCFMPNHLHLIIYGQTVKSNLLDFVHDYKQMTGYNFKQKFKTNLWATSYHDHILRKEENIKSICRYILKNPVRAGLVESILDYPFSGSFIWNLTYLVEDDPFLKND